MKTANILFVIGLLILILGSVRLCHSQTTDINIVKANDGVQTGETSIAVNPSNSNNLMAAFVYSKSGDRHIGYAFSTNGGNTWPDTGYFAQIGPDPSCAFDRNGNAYITFFS